MAQPVCSLPAEFPTEVFDALIREAEEDAVRVAGFLDALGLSPAKLNQGRPVLLPPAFLLELAAALRTLEWESRGLRIHLDAGLPEAQESLHNALQSAATYMRAGAFMPLASFVTRVMDLWFRCFAWNGRAELQADLVLGEADENVLVEALAELLWNHRHDVNPNTSLNRGTP